MEMGTRPGKIIAYQSIKVNAWTFTPKYLSTDIILQWILDFAESLEFPVGLELGTSLVIYSFYCGDKFLINFRTLAKMIESQFFNFYWTQDTLPNHLFLFNLIFQRIGGQLGLRHTSPMSRKLNRRNVGVQLGHQYHSPTIWRIVGWQLEKPSFSPNFLSLLGHKWSGELLAWGLPLVAHLQFCRGNHPARPLHSVQCYVELSRAMCQTQLLFMPISDRNFREKGQCH